MGVIKSTKNNTRKIVELRLVSLAHSQAAKRVIKPINNEKYSIGNLNTAKAIREAKTDAVIILFINMFESDMVL